MKLHSLRHNFGTYLLAMGFDMKVAKELLGHEDINTTLVYAEADAGLPRNAIRSFEELGRNGYKRRKREVLTSSIVRSLKKLESG